MLKAYLNSLKIPKLRSKILFTFGIVLLCRVVCTIPCPGLDQNVLKSMFGAENSAMGMFDLFSGGALSKFAIGALGIMPYISASIIMQIMGPVIPALERMKREGETGRQKMTQITRYLTIVICVIQGFGLVKYMTASSHGQAVLMPSMLFTVTTICILTGGAVFLMWLGEQITERGIGNGASIIITINILTRLPSAILKMIELTRTSGKISYVHLVLLFIVFVVVCAATVALTQAYRKIPIKRAKREGGRTVSGTSSTSFLPLRVNYSGVMPIIFASAVLMFIGIIVNNIGNYIGFFKDYNIAPYIAYGTTGSMILYAVLILGFSFFWVANQFNPIKIADDLQKDSSYVPGIRPGSPTAEYLEHSMVRITFAGATFLTILAVIPMMLSDRFHVPSGVARFLGGTSLLIICGVMLDTMRQVESHLVQNHYDGFVKKGRLRSRRN